MNKFGKSLTKENSDDVKRHIAISKTADSDLSYGSTVVEDDSIIYRSVHHSPPTAVVRSAAQSVPLLPEGIISKFNAASSTSKTVTSASSLMLHSQFENLALDDSIFATRSSGKELSNFDNSMLSSRTTSAESCTPTDSIDCYLRPVPSSTSSAAMMLITRATSVNSTSTGVTATSMESASSKLSSILPQLEITFGDQNIEFDFVPIDGKISGQTDEFGFRILVHLHNHQHHYHPSMWIVDVSYRYGEFIPFSEFSNYVKSLISEAFPQPIISARSWKRVSLEEIGNLCALVAYHTDTREKSKALRSLLRFMKNPDNDLAFRAALSQIHEALYSCRCQNDCAMITDLGNLLESELDSLRQGTETY